jgi:hypothetical protein
MCTGVYSHFDAIKFLLLPIKKTNNNDFPHVLKYGFNFQKRRVNLVILIIWSKVFESGVNECTA